MPLTRPIAPMSIPDSKVHGCRESSDHFFRGRSFQALYKIIPGFTPPGEQNSAAGNPQRSMTSDVNGGSMQANNTRIDGATDTYTWLPANVAYVPRRRVPD